MFSRLQGSCMANCLHDTLSLCSFCASSTCPVSTWLSSSQFLLQVLESPYPISDQNEQAPVSIQLFSWLIWCCNSDFPMHRECLHPCTMLTLSSPALFFSIFLAFSFAMKSTHTLSRCFNWKTPHAAKSHSLLASLLSPQHPNKDLLQMLVGWMICTNHHCLLNKSSQTPQQNSAAFFFWWPFSYFNWLGFVKGEIIHFMSLSAFVRW